MKVDDVRNKLVEGVSDILARDPAEIDTSAMLFDLGMDSLGLVETFVFIEKNFGGLRVLETGIKRENMETLDALSEYIAGLSQ